MYDKEKFGTWVEANKDPYGKCVVDVARAAMEIIDEEKPGEIDGDYAFELLNRADDRVGAGGITGFMAGAAASMITQCHDRGDEFRRGWNIFHQVSDKGEGADDSGGVLNPALMSFGPGKG